MSQWRVVKGMRIKLSNKYAIFVAFIAILTILNINIVSAQQNTSATQMSIYRTDVTANFEMLLLTKMYIYRAKWQFNIFQEYRVYVSLSK